MTARRFTVTAAVLAALLAGGSCGMKAREEKPPSVPLRVNLIKNPSFEKWNGNIPLDWELQRFSGAGERENLCGKEMNEKSGGNCSFFLRGVFNVQTWMVLVQRQPVMPGCRLEFSAEIKATGLYKSKGQEGERANIYVRFLDKDGKRVKDRGYADAFTPPLYGTTDWKRYGKLIDVPKEAWYAEIGLINEMTGRLYFDDVALVLEEPVPWKEISTKYVNYYYLKEYPFPKGAIKKETKFVESCARKLDIKVQGKISYYYYGTEQELKKLLGRRSGHDVTVWKEKKLHTAKSFDNHEMIHMLLADLGHPPFGLAEGAVFYCLGSWDGRDLHMISKELLIQRSIPPLYKILKQEDMTAVGSSKAVPGWASFSVWLIDHHGIEKFMKLYVETNEVFAADSFGERFKSIYGEDFEVMDRNWRLWVLRYQGKQ